MSDTIGVDFHGFSFISESPTQQQLDDAIDRYQKRWGSYPQRRIVKRTEPFGCVLLLGPIPTMPEQQTLFDEVRA